MTARLGITLPLDNVPLVEHRERLREIVDLGYTDVWAGEADGLDAFTPLTAAAAWAPELSIGTGIVPVFTRGPAVLAMTAAALAEMAPGRFTLGIGASSPAVVHAWNSIEHDKPLARVRDTLDFLAEAFTGSRVTRQYSTFTVEGLRLGRPPSPVPDVMVAALRPGMLRLAATRSAGAVLTWLRVDDVHRVLEVLGEDGARPRTVCWLTVCPSEDADSVRDRARPVIAAYLNVPGYAEFYRWLGHDDLLEPVWRAWQAGDRVAAVRAVPDRLVDELIVHGSPESCREQIARYRAAGIGEPALSIQSGSGDPMIALRALAPR